MNLELSSRILTDFEAIDASSNGLSKAPLHTLRKQAIELFRSVKFPTIRHEEWKYTNVMQLTTQEYASQLSTQGTTLTQEDIIAAVPPKYSGSILVFVDGLYNSEMSTILNNDTSCIVANLYDTYHTHQQQIDTRLGTLIDGSTNAFTASNTASIRDGLYVFVPKGKILEHPVLVLSFLSAESNNTFVQPRHLVDVQENSSVTILFKTITRGQNSSLTNSATECFVGDNAHCTCILLQDDSNSASMINTIEVDQQRSSVVTIITCTLNGKIIRNTVGTRLRQSGAVANMYGTYVTSGSTLVDNHTVMDHAVAHCNSNELFKGILGDSSQGVFNGKIFVREDAQKTLAYQSNRNILISENATINTKPQLEIFADDVKCSHGCTVGQLDEESLFYLRSRGISERNAKALLLTAFAEEVTDKIVIESVRDYVNAAIEARLSIE